MGTYGQPVTRWDCNCRWRRRRNRITLVSSEIFHPDIGVWSTVGNLAVARWRHGGVTLADGRAMVVGSASNSELRSAEIFDLSSGTWMREGGLTRGRLYPSPTLLVNGKVLAAGGSDEFGRALADTDLYDPRRNRWEGIRSLNVARSNHTATLLPDGSVLIAGGYGPSGTNLRSAEIPLPAQPLTQARHLRHLEEGSGALPFASKRRATDLAFAFQVPLFSPPSYNSLMSVSNDVRIAMWSGPRNISTAMMRAWGNRDETVVIDEPFYAYYLQATGTQHPGAQEVIATGETDRRKIVDCLIGPMPKGKRIFFQKHMTHHLLPEIDREWLGAVTNCFLIRDPREVINSYIKKREDPTLDDLGFVQQAEIFDFVRTSTNAVPPVVDARDVLGNPERTLRLLCEAVGVDFNKSMLSWSAGLRDTDGIWAKYWYREVAKTTSFQPYRPTASEVPARLSEIYERCRQCYLQLYEHRLH